MNATCYEKREDLRYVVSEKVILFQNNGQNRLAIIQNISRGGAFISMIGAQIGKMDFDLSIGRRQIKCHLLQATAGQLHCKFSQKISDKEISYRLDRGRASPSPMISHATISRHGPMVSHNDRINLPERPIFPAIDRHPDKYVEGWAIGIVQPDLADKTLVGIVAVLTARMRTTDREPWLAGFNDAVKHNLRIAALPE